MTRKVEIMNWAEIKDQRDTDGNLTDLALAVDALEDHGCDCGTDEPHTCLACLCEAGMRELVEGYEARIAELEGVIEEPNADSNG